MGRLPSPRTLAVRHRVQRAFDRLRGLDYLEAVEVADLGLDPALAKRASASDGAYLRPVLRSLGDVRGRKVLDVGCAKGQAMRLLRALPFDRVDGIELAPQLVEVAQRNLRGRAAERSSVWQADARTFDRYGDYDLLYLYNPFTAPVMADVAAQVAAQRPGPLTVVYYAVTCEPELCGPLDLEVVDEFHDPRGNLARVYRRAGMLDVPHPAEPEEGR